MPTYTIAGKTILITGAAGGIGAAAARALQARGANVTDLIAERHPELRRLLRRLEESAGPARTSPQTGTSR